LPEEGETGDVELRVLIADDDEGMRLVLRKIIEREKGFTLAGEARDGEEAVRLAETLQPQVVFLDVEMPHLNGVECAKRITDINPKTILIFATAHQEFMSEAFAVYAFDYIIKPFKLDRVQQTLRRIGELSRQQSILNLDSKSLPAKGLDKLLIRNKEGINLVDMKDILLIQREDRSTVVYTGQERFVTSEGLSELEERLDKNLFFRSHKSYIINLSAISKIYPYGRWTYVVKLKGTEKDALLTHERYEVLETLFQ
jgi:two-component system, LytTR family, response regulator